MESKRRTIAKTISWRIVGITTLFIATYAVGGTIQMSIDLTIINLTLITALYFFHERVWAKIKYGYED